MEPVESLDRDFQAVSYKKRILQDVENMEDLRYLLRNGSIAAQQNGGLGVFCLLYRLDPAQRTI